MHLSQINQELDSKTMFVLRNDLCELLCTSIAIFCSDESLFSFLRIFLLIGAYGAFGLKNEAKKYAPGAFGAFMQNFLIY